MKAKEKKRYVYTVRIDEELSRKLQNKAKVENVTNANLIRKAIKEYVEE